MRYVSKEDSSREWIDHSTTFGRSTRKLCIILGMPRAGRSDGGRLCGGSHDNQMHSQSMFVRGMVRPSPSSHLESARWPSRHSLPKHLCIRLFLLLCPRLPPLLHVLQGLLNTSIFQNPTRLLQIFLRSVIVLCRDLTQCTAIQSLSLLGRTEFPEV